jgi:hypothetical protein
VPTEITVEGCSKCGATMNFISFIDRETKKEIKGSSALKGTVFLLKPFKKYRCSNGHEETNE